MIQFTEMFCFQGVTSKNFFNLGLDVRWLLPLVGKYTIELGGLAIPEKIADNYFILESPDKPYQEPML